ncbi:hypothetical protein O3P69_020747 [Scylla paramamosain]|uniref:Uncharacterized protein n=1 Tax=Scylla paramamosain TaxID=85552 RepID=A0AAW0TPI1_SCYPA
MDCVLRGVGGVLSMWRVDEQPKELLLVINSLDTRNPRRGFPWLAPQAPSRLKDSLRGDFEVLPPTRTRQVVCGRRQTQDVRYPSGAGAGAVFLRQEGAQERKKLTQAWDLVQGGGGSETVPPFEGLPEGPTREKSLGESGARGDERHVDTVPGRRSLVCRLKPRVSVGEVTQCSGGSITGASKDKLGATPVIPAWLQFPAAPRLIELLTPRHTHLPLMARSMTSITLLWGHS